MCGLFAYAGLSPASVDAIRHVARLVSRRGPHASGVAWDSGSIEVCRSARPWKDVEDQYLEKVRSSTRTVGHFRLATSGDRTDPTNAQPIPVGGGAIAHNGTIEGYLEKARRERLSLSTECDSELWGLAVERDQGPRVERLRRALALFGGRHVVIGLWPGEIVAASSGLPLFRWRHGEGSFVASVAGHPDARPVAEWMF